MTQFKVGDRVKVYGDVTKSNSNGCHFVFNGAEAVVASMCLSGWMIVSLSDEKFLVHPKQCRKLKGQKLVEGWINLRKDEDIYYAVIYPSEVLANTDRQPSHVRTIHMREVKKK